MRAFCAQLIGTSLAGCRSMTDQRRLRAIGISALVALLSSASSVLAQEEGTPTQPPPAPPAVAPTPAPATPVSAAQAHDPSEQAPPDIDDSRPLRHGFTLELGVGLSLVNVNPDAGTSTMKLGLAPLSLSLGGFITENVALLLRCAGASNFEDDSRGKLAQVTTTFYGAHVQYWFNDRFMMSGGPGVMVFSKSSVTSPFTAENAAVGYGASVRAGYAVFANTHHALRFSVEAFPAKYENAFVFGSALNFEWQYY